MNSVREALNHIPSDDRDTWVMMGMAVKSELGDSGFDLWNEWSQQAESYAYKSARDVWKSIKAGGKVTVATLYHFARLNGWHGDESVRQRSAEEHRARMAELAAIADCDDAIKRKRRAEAAQKAQSIIKTAKVDVHPYLAEKGLPEAKCLVLPDGELLIPMRDAQNNALLGTQIIRLEDNEWAKKMMPGMRAKGAVLRLGRGAETVLCEGYATGLSIDLAARLLRLNLSVLVCFSAGNLTHVAGLIGGKRYIFADHDVSKAGEQSAIKAGLPYVMSPDIGDANDLHQQRGLMAVSKLLMEVRNK